MKLSRFRRIRTTREKTTRLSSKPKLRFYLAALASLILGFSASLYFFFPASALEERVEYEINGRTPVQADLIALSLGFPPSMRADKLILKIDQPQPYSMTFDKASVKPLWHSLFGGNPGVAIHTDILGGEGGGTIRRNGDMEVSIAGVVFDAPLPSLTSLRLSGNLKNGVIVTTAPVKPTTESQLEINLENIRITGLKSVGIGNDALSLGAVSLRGSGKGNSFRIEQLESEGGDLKLSGGGTLLFGRTIESSRLNLNVVLSPTPPLDKDMAEMLSLFRQPGRDGSYRFRVTGAVANPVVK